MGKANKVGNPSKNQPKFSISAGKGLVGGESGFGVPYQSISKGKYFPTKNGGKGRPNAKIC